MSDSKHNRPRLGNDELVPYQSPSWTRVPNWFFDRVLGNPDLPVGFTRFFLFVWRQTMGWSWHTATLTTRQFEQAGIRDTEAARWAHAFHFAGLIDYKPADYGDARKKASVFRLLPAIGDPEKIDVFLLAVGDVMKDSRYAPRGVVAADIFGQRVAARMAELRAAPVAK